MKNPIQKPSYYPALRGLACVVAVAAFSAGVAQAIPYASSVTNNNGTIKFYLNEGGGNVTVTYDNGSTNSSFNGITTGTNLASGLYSFALGSHASYSISVFKAGAGSPSLISSQTMTPRGIGVNMNSTSPYFGRVYAAAATAGGLYAMNPDMSLAFASVQSAGVSWMNDGFSPYRLSVAADDSVMVGDAGWDGSAFALDAVSSSYYGLNDGVWRLDPNLTTNQLFLGPAGYNAYGYGVGGSQLVHGTPVSEPLIFGNPSTGPVTLMDVDSDFNGPNGYNELMVYTNITLANLPYEDATNTTFGPSIVLNGLTMYGIGNIWTGLQYLPAYNYIYCTCYRANGSNPNLQIYSFNPATGFSLTGPDYQGAVWDSQTAAGLTAGCTCPGDPFTSTNVGGYPGSPVDVAVSQDGLYLVTVSWNGGLIICPLTNGLPNLAALYTYAPAIVSSSGIARGVCFDAADNLYVSSSAAGGCFSYSLGLTATAVTTGNATGSTGFTVTFPPANVSVVATTPVASQGGSDGVVGTPVPGVFTLTRTGSTTKPLTVFFSLSGTATNGVYTCTPASVLAGTNLGAVTIPANSSSTTVTITPTTANVPRLTTTVVLTLLGGTNYSAASPSFATADIINTSTNLVVMSAGYPTMYKAFSNDYATVTLTRLGDTNVSYTIPATAFSYSGSAVSGTDFIPIPAVNVPLGAVTLNPFIQPLSNGVPPSDTLNALYAGNKSVTVGFTGGTGYGAAGSPTTLTLIDNAQTPGPVLFSDPLTNPNDASNWRITYGTADQAYDSADYNVQFGYDLTSNNGQASDNGVVGSPPGGATTALRVNCNVNDSITYAGGVNVYYTGQKFSGNFAVRFNMNITEGDSQYNIAGPLFGINCDGTQTNWWLGSGTVASGSGPWNADGVWYWVAPGPGGYGGFYETEFQEYTGAGPVANNGGWTALNSATASTYQGVFKSSVYPAAGGIAGGVPANNSSVWAGGLNSFGVPTNAASSWSDVEIKQINNVITLSIDKTVIFSYVNTNTATSLSQSGYVMLGYDSPLQGAFHNYLNTPDGAVYFANLVVIALNAPTITSIHDALGAGGNSVTIDFTMPTTGYAASSFALQSASTPGGTYADVSGATITQLGPESFQATATLSGPAQCFRVRTND